MEEGTVFIRNDLSTCRGRGWRFAALAVLVPGLGLAVFLAVLVIVTLVGAGVLLTGTRGFRRSAAPSPHLPGPDDN